MTTTICGVKFSDQMGALLDHAEAHDFRLEPDTRGKRAGGLVAYPPDANFPPITVSEKQARLNKPHYENIKRSFYRAGCPPLPGDEKHHTVATTSTDDGGFGFVEAETADEARAKLPEGTEVFDLNDLDGSPMGDFLDNSDSEALVHFLGQAVRAITQQAGIGRPEQELIAGVSEFVTYWATTYSRDRITEAVKLAQEAVTSQLKRDIEESLTMAQDAEARADRAEKALTKAEQREQQARNDCGAALRRAEEAEKQARELEAAIAPLRKILGKAS